MTLLEIDLKKLKHNYFSLRKRLNPDTKMIGVVKANAYGSLMAPISKKLVEWGIETLAVAYAAEGVKLRQNAIKIPIMVFYPQTESFKEIINNNLEPVLYSKRSWEKFVEVANGENHSAYPVHIKYNSGLNRIGFRPNEVEWVLKQLKNSPLVVKTVYSHLAQTESPKPDFKTDNQISSFQQIVSRHRESPEQKPEYHLLNTSGVFNYPEHQMDWVRVGIGLYGFANQPQWNESLQPIAQLKTIITQIHNIEPGETVGYNCGWRAANKTRIAVLPIGHADGFSRYYGHGKGWVLINGKKAPVVGNVCMDMIMVEIGEITCHEGSEVIVIGEDIRADKLAEKAGTISYELLSGLGNRIQRVLVE